MDKKSKEALRRYKKGRAREASSSESSSSSDSETGSSSSYSSSDSDRKSSAVRRHRKKKVAHSEDERRSKREKRELCQKKLEAKREHLKRKLREAKLKQKAAAAAAVLSGHCHRSSLSPLTQAKLKKLAERRHLREVSKERREREKHLVREREHVEHQRSRSPSKIAKLRLHADIIKRQTNSPQRMHQQLMSREKIIIQTRTHEHTPSLEHDRGQRHNEHKLRRDDRRERDRERVDREAARDKERADALARCQERQRERERIAREKLRREDELKKYGSTVSGNERNVPVMKDYDMMYHGGHAYNDRERSLEALERTRYNTKRELDLYERECSYIEERRGIVEDPELRHERDATRRREPSPTNERYMPRVRDVREMYTEEERERSFNRPYHVEPLQMRYPRERNNWTHTRDMRDPREAVDYNKREHEPMYEEREHDALIRERGRERKGMNQSEWKGNWEHNEWGNMSGQVNKVPNNRNEFNDTFKHANESKPQTENRVDSEPDWDVDDHKDKKYKCDQLNTEIKNDDPNQAWLDVRKSHDNKMNINATNRENITDVSENLKRQNDWHNDMSDDMNQQRMMANNLNFNRTRPYRERPAATNYRQHPQPLINMPMQTPRMPFHGNQRPLNKRNMTYTNPNIIKKQQAALAAVKAATQASAVAAATAVAAAKAAAQSAANATTNPGILGQVRQYQIYGEKPEPGEIVMEEKKVVGTNTQLEKGSEELSEISDSDDEILNNIEKKPSAVADKVVEDNIEMGEIPNIENIEAIVQENDTVCTAEVDDMLAFEEISDGEFEEDTRLKNVADALGVDWASLIAESRALATESSKNSNELAGTSAKQRWQAHRVLWQVGVSRRLAGDEFAKRLLDDTQAKFRQDVVQEVHVKNEDTTEEKVKEDTKPIDKVETTEALVSESVLKPFAFSQVYDRQHLKIRNQMFVNICGPNSRALSARQDLRLRRQLCGLPAEDCEIAKPIPRVSEKLKTLALNAFNSALQVN